MCDYIIENNIVNHELMDSICTELQNNDLPFADSDIYIVKDKENLIDKTIRNSQFREFKTKSMFNLVKKYLEQFNTPQYTYELVENDIN